MAAGSASDLTRGFRDQPRPRAASRHLSPPPM